MDLNFPEVKIQVKMSLDQKERKENIKLNEETDQNREMGILK